MRARHLDAFVLLAAPASSKRSAFPLGCSRGCEASSSSESLGLDSCRSPLLTLSRKLQYHVASPFGLPTMADIPALWLYRSDADGATVGPVELGVLAAAWAAGDIDGLTPVAAAPDARDAAVPLPVFQPLSSVPPLRAALAAIPVAGEEVDADEFGTASAEASMAAAGGVGLAGATQTSTPRTGRRPPRQGGPWLAQ